MSLTQGLEPARCAGLAMLPSFSLGRRAATLPPSSLCVELPSADGQESQWSDAANMQRHERRELARAMVDDGGAGAAASFLYNSALSQPTPQPRILAHAAGGGPRSARPDAEAAEAAERRQLHGLHIALSSCRQEKDALEKTLRHETGRLRQQLVAVTEEHDALLGRQQTSDAVISKLQDREDRAARLENSVELRRELGDVAEAALTTARDRILALEADLAASLLRINRLEEGDDLRHTSLLAQSDEAAAEAAAAHAESSADTEWLDDAGVPANTRCEGAATVLTTDSGALQPAVTSRGEATAIGLGPPGAATGGRLGATGVTTEWLDDVGVSDQGGPANQTSTSTSAPAWVNAFADVTLELVDASLGTRWDCPTQNPPADLCRWFCAGCVLMATNCFTCCVHCLL